MNYAIDKVDDRDFDAEILLGAEENLPSSKMISDGVIQDQSLLEETKYGCVFFAGSSISNTMNFLAREPERILGKDLCKIAEDKGVLDIKLGAYVVSSPELLKELGYIKTFGRCYNLYQVKLSIFKDKPVQTGSQTISRSKTKANNNVAVRKTASGGHSFFICGYDDEREILICENSYGEENYDKGYFFIKYEDFDLLFNSKYIMADTPREDYEQKVLDSIKLEPAKKAYTNGFWNGLNQDLPITRGEAAVMAQRAYEKAFLDAVEPIR